VEPGDYGKVGSLLGWLGESLVRELDIHSGERVLDVAAGNGNASLPALRRFADVLATDYVPDLLSEAEQRAAVDGFALARRWPTPRPCPSATRASTW
jgi:2-polyprenyl-3-methyl-5-hydroxy-6-metoxy-1,4-benzoquinol methylase